MAQKETFRVRGYRELIRGLKTIDRDSRREIRAVFRTVGEVVRVDAARRISPVDTRTAAGYKTRVRQRGVAVEQSLRKTTGQHPEYGSLQMRKALLPALLTNQDELERGLERALDQVADQFNRGSSV